MDRRWSRAGGVHRLARDHEDIDLVVFSHDLDALRAQLGDRFHLWSNHGGTVRVIDDEQPEPLDPLSQVWLREDARSPWRVDCILNPSREGRWVSRQHDDFEADLDDVTWTAADGIRYLAPEVALLFKAKQHRPKDEADLTHAWPLLDERQRNFLRDGVQRRYGDEHPWWERLTRDG